MATRADDPTAEATDLLRDLIRNQCVNDGRVESGQETKSVDLLGNYPRAPGSTSSATSRNPVAAASSPGSRAAIRRRRRCS